MGSIEVHMDPDTEGSPTAAAAPSQGSPAKLPADHTGAHDCVDERALQELSQAASGNFENAPSSSPLVADTDPENPQKPEDPSHDEEVATKKRKLSTGSASPVKPVSQPHTPQQSPSKPQPQQSEMAKKLDPATKRLREEEKERKAKEREEKAREREEKAKQKEAEKAARDEAKRIKDEERAKEKAKRDEEKAKKDAAKAAEEEKRAKKERAQLRLNSFFVKKESNGVSAASSRQASIEPTSPAQTPKKGQQDAVVQTTDFEKSFPSFFLHPHTTLASSPFVQPTEAEGEEAWSQIHAGEQVLEAAELVLQRTFKRPSTKRPMARLPQYTTKQLVALANCTPADCTTLTSTSAISAHAELSALPVKFLKYHEDVRPPYIGTFTKRPMIPVTKLCRRPHTRHALAAVNYDYDSEAEWEEPEEGEELGSEDEDDPEDDGAEEDNEMDDFIDDADADGSGAKQPSPKKQQLTSDDLVPKCTGLFWEEDHDSTVIPYGDEYIDMEQFRAVCLLPGVTEPIDPWSTKYWDPEPEDNDKSKSVGENGSVTTASGSGAVTTGTLAGTKRKKGFKVPAKPLPSELMQEFKDFVFSKALSKLGMIEVLKDKFPQITKATLEQTLEQVAKREGKKWVPV